MSRSGGPEPTPPPGAATLAQLHPTPERSVKSFGRSFGQGRVLISFPLRFEEGGEVRAGRGSYALLPTTIAFARFHAQAAASGRARQAA